MSYLRYFCLFTNSGVQHMLCCVFLFVFVFRLAARFSGLPFFIPSSVFSNVYLKLLQILLTRSVIF